MIGKSQNVSAQQEARPHQMPQLSRQPQWDSLNRIIAAATQAIILSGLVLVASSSMGSGSSMDSDAVDYRAELMRYAFEPCMMVSAWHSGMAARIGAEEAVKLLRERRAADIAQASDRIIAQVRGQSRSYRLGIYRSARVGCIDAALGDGR